MKILVVATKPPWPPRDGGRLVLCDTVQALLDAGHDVALVAPADAVPADTPPLAALEFVPVPRRSWFAALADAARRGEALTVARHRLPVVAAAVARLVETWRPDVVHAEQLQALANCGAARARGVPIVLRMQNVESSLWMQVARARLMSRPLAIEARRLRRDEQRAFDVAARVVALTDRDADALRAIGRRDVDAIAPSFPSTLPAGARIDGAPAIAIAGSSGWWPNRQGTQWFLDAVLPTLRAARPDARVHVYGGESVDDAGAVWHAAPDDARDAFPDGAIAAIPLLIGSGIRMRVLDAWARGLPVVATSVAAAGLHVESGRELLIADTPGAFADAIRRIADDPALRANLAAAGRAYLAARHDPQRQAQALAATYERARTLAA